jgi:hypothetical protein
MSTKLNPVGSSYGAPMGRVEERGEPQPRSVRLERVRINRGGYDAGGAYWGIGRPLYMAHGPGYRRFVRAVDREDAAVSLNLTPAHLIRSTKP